MINKFDRAKQSLYLTPQNESDQGIISRLNEAGMLASMARDPENDYIHAEVKLERPESIA